FNEVTFLAARPVDSVCPSGGQQCFAHKVEAIGDDVPLIDFVERVILISHCDERAISMAETCTHPFSEEACVGILRLSDKTYGAGDIAIRKLDDAFGILGRNPELVDHMMTDIIVVKQRYRYHLRS